MNYDSILLALAGLALVFIFYQRAEEQSRDRVESSRESKSRSRVESSPFLQKHQNK